MGKFYALDISDDGVGGDISGWMDSNFYILISLTSALSEGDRPPLDESCWARKGTLCTSLLKMERRYGELKRLSPWD